MSAKVVNQGRMDEKIGSKGFRLQCLPKWDPCEWIEKRASMAFFVCYRCSFVSF